MSNATATSTRRLGGKRLFSRTRVVALGIAAAVMLALAASAGADTLYKSGSVNVGDCSVQAFLYKDNNPGFFNGDFYGAGKVVCGQRHNSTEAQVTLKSYGGAVSYSQNVFYWNSFGLGSNFLNTTPVPGCGNWQVVVQALPSGLPYTYATTGSPIAAC